MSRSERLKPVVEVAQSCEREAARAFAEHQRMVENERARLEQLQVFRADYLCRLQEQGQGGLSAARLREWQRFLAGLDQAVEQQRSQVAAAEQRCEQVREQWHLARGKRSALGKVVERCRSEEERSRARREQKEIDEFAQRKRSFD